MAFLGLSTRLSENKIMSMIVIDGLDHRTTSDTVKNYCQNFGRVLNCYIKFNQCSVTFADKHQAEEFIRASPHRIDSNGPVNATGKVTLDRIVSAPQRSANDTCRLTVRGTFEQIEEKNLVQYFSRFGNLRMCLANASQGSATITFDDRTSAERALKEPRHFLNGRSLSVEVYTSEEESESTKRMKYSDPNQSTLSVLTSRFEHEKDQLIDEQKRLQIQLHERMQVHEYEKQQWNDYLIKQQTEYLQQIAHYQYLLKQSLDEINNKDKQIEQLKQENKDIDDLLRQSVHDNEQQQIQLRKREDVHNQTKRKYEDIYKAYMKLKDHSSIPVDKEKHSLVNKPQSTIDNVRKKL